MSHFCSMVIITPDCQKNLDECLEEYNENKKVPEYILGVVSDYNKVTFLSYYADKRKEINKIEIETSFATSHQGEEGYKTLEAYKQISPYNWTKDNAQVRFAGLTIQDHPQDYVDFFKKKCSSIWNNFDAMYMEYGESWNGDSWRINPDTGLWSAYSTYNPNSVFDYFTEGWYNALKTKSGEYVDRCLLGEIDWRPFIEKDYLKTWKKDFWGNKYHPLKKGVTWHFNEKDVPYTVFINDNHLSRGKVGWFGTSEDELSEEEWEEKFFDTIKDLDPQSEVFLLDCHI